MTDDGLDFNIPLGRDDNDDDANADESRMYVDDASFAPQQPFFTPSSSCSEGKNQHQQEQQQQQQQQGDAGALPPSSFPSPTTTTTMTTTNPRFFASPGPSPARAPPPRSPTPDGVRLKDNLELQFVGVFNNIDEHLAEFKNFVGTHLQEVAEEMKEAENDFERLAVAQNALITRNEGQLEALQDEWRRANAELESGFN